MTPVRLLALVAGVSLLASIGADPSAFAIVGVASMVVALAGCCIAVLASGRDAAPTAPARAHRHRVDAVPAPRHPNTVGRRRARAPSTSVVVA